jgi:hypothetical protein
MQTPVRGDFHDPPKPSKFGPCTPQSVSKTRPTKLAEEEIMNIETLELNAVAETAQADDSLEMLALSLDDLDIVGGGSVIGVLA